MRCKYCHNPDTWNVNGGREVTVQQLLAEYDSCAEFYKNGGITVTGGEPLMQAEFVAELFGEAKRRGIHTCLDTSGITFNPDNAENIESVIASTDLVMLDIKHIDPAKHADLTAHSNENILRFARWLSDKRVPMWIRHVVVPNITDDEESLYRLGRFIGALKSVKALDILPYHDMGVSKYERLGIDYPLKGVPPADERQTAAAKVAVMRGIRDERSGKAG